MRIAVKLFVDLLILLYAPAISLIVISAFLLIKLFIFLIILVPTATYNVVQIIRAFQTQIPPHTIQEGHRSYNSIKRKNRKEYNHMEYTRSVFDGGFDFGEDIEVIYSSEEFEESKEQKPFSYTQNDVDEKLASLLASTLDRGFQYLIQQYQVELLAKACSILRNQHTAEEVVQVAWAKAYRAMRSYPEERIRGLCLRPWLHTIVRNIAFEYYDREKRFTNLFSFKDGTIVEKEGSRFEQPDIALICAESISELHILVSQLPLHYAEVIQMRFFYESIGSESGSYNWIAQELDCPVGTVKCSVNRGLHLLRKALQAKKVQLQELEILSL